MKPIEIKSPVLAPVAVIAISLALSSCGLFSSNERPVYQGAEYYKNLEVPPDLTEPDTADELRVPRPTEEALQRFRDNHDLDTVITPKFDGVRMVSYAGNSWLEIDNDVEHVWPRLLEFWEKEGIAIAQERPLLGFMETEWTERMGGEDGYFRSLFQKFEPDQKDRFRVRIERFADGKKTRLYISHARAERKLIGEFSEEYMWVSMPSSLEAEREIISRMALFAGLSKEQSVALLENYRPYSSLVKIDRSSSTSLIMKGSMDFVWRRSMRALDRMNMDEIKQEPHNNTIHFVVPDAFEEELEVDEDELSKSSWMMNIFTGDSGGDASKNTSRQYRLLFTDLEGSIKVEVSDARNSADTDEAGDEYGTALAEQIRNRLVKKLE